MGSNEDENLPYEMEFLASLPWTGVIDNPCPLVRRVFQETLSLVVPSTPGY